MEILVSAAPATVPGDCHRLQGDPLRIDATGPARSDRPVRLHYRGDGRRGRGISCPGELPRLTCAKAGPRPAECTSPDKRLLHCSSKFPAAAVRLIWNYPAEKAASSAPANKHRP